MSSQSELQSFRKTLEGYAKEPPDETVEVFDPNFPSLSYRVGPRGKPAWAWRYRWEGHHYRQKLGKFPAVSLAAVHTLVEKAQGRLTKGEHPFPPEEAAIAERTVAAEAKEFFAEYLARLPSGPETNRLIVKNFLPRYGKRLIVSIERRDIRDCIKAVRKRVQAAAVAEGADEETVQRAGVTANRVKVALHCFFAWVLEQEHIAANPCVGVKNLVLETPRDRLLTHDEIRAVWEAAGNPDFAPYGDIVKLLFFTTRRLGEVSRMKWSEVHLEFDRLGKVVGGEWRLPIKRTKKKKAPQLTPLTKMAARIIAAQPRIAGCDFVFTKTGKKPVSSFSAFEKKLYAAAALAEPWTLHDIRTAVATNCQKLGVRLEVTESMLGHVSGSRSGVVGIYQQHDFYAEKGKAFRRWADRLEEIVTGRASSNVVTLGAAR